MSRYRHGRRLVPTAVACVVWFAGVGCHSMPKKEHFQADPAPDLNLPKELDKVTMPAYRLEPPDILLIDATRVIPLPPYKAQPLDVLYISTPRPPIQEEPIRGFYPVEPDGTINLGENYGGAFRVADMTTQQIEKLINDRLKREFKDFAPVNVSLAQSRGGQQISGQHLIRPDGTVGLGTYGSVYVAGLTLGEAKLAIEQHLSRYLYKPEISIDVFAYNTKWYYVITDFAGSGDQVVRVPHTGNETVLDAISQVGGRSPVSSLRMWIARPAPAGNPDQILPVDWKGITRRGHTATNYQVLPGDRVFVMSQPLTKLDTYLGRALAPAERALGVTLLGQSVFNNRGLFGGNNVANQ